MKSIIRQIGNNEYDVVVDELNPKIYKKIVEKYGEGVKVYARDIDELMIACFKADVPSFFDSRFERKPRDQRIKEREYLLGMSEADLYADTIKKYSPTVHASIFDNFSLAQWRITGAKTNKNQKRPLPSPERLSHKIPATSGMVEVPEYVKRWEGAPPKDVNGIELIFLINFLIANEAMYLHTDPFIMNIRANMHYKGNRIGLELKRRQLSHLDNEFANLAIKNLNGSNTYPLLGTSHITESNGKVRLATVDELFGLSDYLGEDFYVLALKKAVFLKKNGTLGFKDEGVKLLAG